MPPEKFHFWVTWFSQHPDDKHVVWNELISICYNLYPTSFVLSKAVDFSYQYIFSLQINTSHIFQFPPYNPVEIPLFGGISDTDRHSCRTINMSQLPYMADFDNTDEIHTSSEGRSITLKWTIVTTLYIYIYNNRM